MNYVIIYNQFGRQLFGCKCDRITATPKEFEKVLSDMEFGFKNRKLKTDVKFRLYDSTAGFKDSHDADEYMQCLEKGIDAIDAFFGKEKTNDSIHESDQR